MKQKSKQWNGLTITLLVDILASIHLSSLTTNCKRRIWTFSFTYTLRTILLIFFLTRYDKRQTKYTLDEKGLHFKSKTILWNDKYKVKFKKNIFFVLHKPRFIVTFKGTKIVVPVLSSKINKFINKVKNSYIDGSIVESIYQNIKSYYITNEKLTKTLNKNKQN